MTERFEELPEELQGIIAVTFECKDPQDECDFKSNYDVIGPYPRLNEEGFIVFGDEVPLYCPECKSAIFEVNGVEIQNSSP